MCSAQLSAERTKKVLLVLQTRRVLILMQCFIEIGLKMYGLLDQVRRYTLTS